MKKSSTENKKEIQWTWKPKRWWVSLVGFCFVSIVGGGLVAITKSFHGLDETAFIIVIMMGYAISSICNERKNSSIVWRIVWIFGVWIVHAVLAVIIALFIIVIPGLSNRLNDYELNVITTTLAAIPFVIWAMRRWTYFVEHIPDS